MVKICPDEETVAQAAAEIFIDLFRGVTARSERFSVVLSGGKTPMRTYEILTFEPFKSQVDWSRVHIFWGDERCVPITDSRSNYGTAHRIFLSRVPVPVHQIHPILGTREPSQSAMDYEATLRSYFGISPPIFDFMFLGLGKDGHTASLFPGSSALNEKERWVTAVQNATEEFARITLTPQILNLTQMALFLVTGKEKAQILKKVLAKVEPSPPLPAQLIHPSNGNLLWLVDSLAHPSTQV